VACCVYPWEGDLPALGKPGVSRLCLRTSPADQLGTCKGASIGHSNADQLDSVSSPLPSRCLRFGEDKE